MNRNKKVSGKSFVAKASAASLALMMTATSVPATTLTAFAAETPEAAYAAEFEAFTEADKEVTSNKYISLIGNKTIYTGDNKVKVIKSKKSGVTIKKITSSKTSVVKVDKKGVLTAVKPGTATITVTTNQGTVRCKITVKDAISFATPKLYAGGKATTVLTKVDKKSTITSVTSSKKDVATITKAGKLTPIKKGTTKLTIKVKSSNGTTKTYTKSYTVMADGVKTLTIKTNPTKMVYQVGDEFDKTGLTLNALYKSGKKSVIAASKVTVSGFDSSKAGTSTVKLSYAGKSLSLKVTVTEKEVATVTGIAVTGMPQSVEVGSDWAEAKKAIKVVEAMSDGTEGKEVTAESTISDVDTSKEGEQEVTVTYKEFSTTATVKVVAKAVVEDTVEEKVAAYEKATAATYLEYAASTKAKAEATEAIATVEDEAKKAELTARVDKKSEEIEAAIKVYVDAVNTANTQAKIMASLNAFFDDANEKVILQYAEIFTGKTEFTADEIQRHVYEQNFLMEFMGSIYVSPALPPEPAVVNQLSLKKAIVYGSEKGILIGVNVDYYFDAYVKIAESYTSTNEYNTVDAIQTSMIDGCIRTLISNADAAVVVAKNDPANEDKIKAADELVNTIPADVVITKEMPRNAGLKIGDNALEGYQKIMGELKAVYGVRKVLAEATVNQKDLLAALADEHFECVWEDYIIDYTDLRGKDLKTVEAIQQELYDIADQKATAAVTAAETTTTEETVAAAQKAIDRMRPDYPATETEAARTTVATLQKQLDAAKAEIATDIALKKIEKWTDTNSSDSENTLLAQVKSDLKELGRAESKKETPAFVYETVDVANNTNVENIRKAVRAKTVVGPITAADVQDIVIGVALDKVDKWNAEDAATVKADLLRVEKAISSQKEPKFKMDMVYDDDTVLVAIKDGAKGNVTGANNDVAIEALVAKIKLATVKCVKDADSAERMKIALASVAQSVCLDTTPAFTMSIVNLTPKALNDLVGAVGDAELSDAATVKTFVQATALDVVKKWSTQTEDVVKKDLITLSIATDFDYACVVEKYWEQIRDAVIDKKDSILDFKDLTGVIEGAYVDALITITKKTSYTKAELKEAFEVVGRAKDFTAATAREDRYEDYAAKIKGQTLGSTTAKAIQEIVTEANAVYDVNNAKTVAEMKAALAEVAEINNTADYVNLSSEGKTDVAELFMLEDTFGEGAIVGAARTKAIGKYDATSEMVTDLGKLITAVKGLIENTNDACADPGKGKVVDVMGALSAIKYQKYDELTATQKMDVAESVLNAYPTVVDPATGQKNPIANSFKTLTQIRTAIDTAIAEVVK